MSARFSIRFINKDAVREYQKLDGSVKKLVNIGLKKLEERADQIGKPLAGGLQGCKELKYRKHGIRVIFRISAKQIEIVEIVAIGARSKGEVFASAQSRLASSTRPRWDCPVPSCPDEGCA